MAADDKTEKGRAARMYDHATSGRHRPKDGEEKGGKTEKKPEENDPASKPEANGDGGRTGSGLIARIRADHTDLHGMQEKERRDLHGTHRDEHRKVHARHLDELAKAKDHGEMVATHRRHEEEVQAMHNRHHQAHREMADRHHAALRAMHAKHEGMMADEKEE